MFSSLALAAVLLSARAAPIDTDAEFRGLIRLPQWPQESIGVLMSSTGEIRLSGDTPLAREALVTARHAFEKNPADPRVYNKLHKLLTQTGDDAGAAALMRKVCAGCQAAAAKNPKDWKAQCDLACVLTMDGDVKGAEAAARRAVALAPGETDAWTALAEALKRTRWNEAIKAGERAVTVAGDDDLDTRLWLALLRIRAHERRIRRLPVFADPAVQGAVIAEVHQTLLNIDKLLAAAAKRLKAADGTCGPDTRQQCLTVLMTRDVLRDRLQMLLRVEGAKVKPEALFSAATAKLILEIIPPTSDDPIALYAAASLQCASTAEGLRVNAMSMPPATRKAIDPYLRRLKELSNDPSSARAATALFLQGVVLEMLYDRLGAARCYQRAVRLVPTFDLAWSVLLGTVNEDQGFHITTRGALLGSFYTADLSHELAIAREWAAKSGSVYARYMLATAQAAVGDWPAADRTITAALDKYPNDPRLMISRGVCCLRLTTTKEDIEVAQLEAVRAYSRLNEPGVATRGTWREYVRLAILCCARSGQLQHGLQGVDQYAQQARSRGEKADAAALRRFFGHLATSPLKPLQWPKVSYPVLGDVKRPSQATRPGRAFIDAGSAALFGDAKQPSKTAPKDNR